MSVGSWNKSMLGMVSMVCSVAWLLPFLEGKIEYWRLTLQLNLLFAPSLYSIPAAGATFTAYELSMRMFDRL
jgi:hypothetical protein